MPTILHIDASARNGSSSDTRHGSHTRRLTSRFVAGWAARLPHTEVLYRDVGSAPPRPVTGAWIHAAFTPTAQRDPWMHEVLQESDLLVSELLRADVIVAGVPMYNFGPPSGFKAYIDNIVRVGRTFGFDRSRAGEPYWPLLAQQHKQLVLLSSRGDYGYGQHERLASRNHVEPSIRTAFAYIGVTDVHQAAIEYDEFADERLAHAIAQAEQQTDHLVDTLIAQRQWVTPARQA